MDNEHPIGLGIAVKAPMPMVHLLCLIAILPRLRDGKSPIQKREMLTLLCILGCGVGIVNEVKGVKELVDFRTVLIDFIQPDVGKSLVGMLPQEALQAEVQGHIGAVWCIRLVASFAHSVGLHHSSDLLKSFIGNGDLRAILKFDSLHAVLLMSVQVG
jgi:hypothetical protein